MSNYTNFYYDPATQGYDVTVWRTVFGTPSIATGALVLDDAVVQHVAQVERGVYEFRVRNAHAPTTGDSAQFGLFFYNKNAYIVFDITGTNLTAQVHNGQNGESSDPITWNSDWTNTSVRFKIRWENSRAEFYIEDVKKATLTNYVPNGPLSLWVKNQNATGTISVSYIEATGVNTYIVVSGTDEASGITFPTLLYSPSVNDAITLTESVSLSIV